MFVYHPTARGKRVLEAYPQARPFFEALAASQDGFVREAADVLGTGADHPWALVRKTGARGLRSILERALLDTMYDLPSLQDVIKVVVDETVIDKGAAPLMIHADATPVAQSA